MKTGDRVICIDANSHGDNDTPPLIRDREYIIYDIAKCSCGCIIYENILGLNVTVVFV